MRRYYFHTDSQRDLNGAYLPSLADAKCEAMAVAGRMMCDQTATFWDAAEWCLTVSDQDNLTLFQLNIIGTDAPSIRRSSAARPVVQ
jgi:hypothetical protein